MSISLKVRMIQALIPKDCLRSLIISHSDKPNVGSYALAISAKSQQKKLICRRLLPRCLES